MRSRIRRSRSSELAARIRRRLGRRGGAVQWVVALTLVGALLLLGICGPIIWRHPDTMTSFYLAPPGQHGFALGTDQFGRSLLTRIVWGIRTSLAISAASIGTAFALGTAIGLVSARLRRVDLVLMRVMDIFMAFPAILLAIGIMAMIGPGVSGVVAAIAIVYTPIFARVGRSAALEEMPKEYVAAAVAAGASTPRVLVRHVFPNVWPLLLIQLSLALSDAILIEAALSYLGLGVLPPTASLGQMLRNGQSLMFNAPWTAIYPGLAIAVAVFGFNLLGDALRDRADVRMIR